MTDHFQFAHVPLLTGKQLAEVCISAYWPEAVKFTINEYDLNLISHSLCWLSGVFLKKKSLS